MDSVKVGLVKRQAVVTISGVLLAVLLATAFNNCTGQNLKGDNPGTVQGSTGNGDGYAGKMQIYNYEDAAQPCAEQNVNGKPLANSQVFHSGSTADLVRENCQDIVPKKLTDFQLQVDGSLLVDGISFQPRRPGDLEVRAAVCPAGLNPKPGAVRNNLVFAAQDLTNTDEWDFKLNSMSTLLTGSFAGMPAFRLRREKDATVETWLRLSQFLLLQGNKDYAFSIFAKGDSVSSLKIDVYGANGPNTSSGGGLWDLSTGANLDDWNEGIANTGFVSTPIAGGYFITYFFRTASFTNGMDFGFAPGNPAQGSSITVTDPQLELVDTYCEL